MIFDEITQLIVILRFWQASGNMSNFMKLKANTLFQFNLCKLIHLQSKVNILFNKRFVGSLQVGFIF